MLGGAKLVNSPDLIAAGQLTSNIPDRPDPPSGHSSGQSSSLDSRSQSNYFALSFLGQLIAVGTRPSNKVSSRYRFNL